MIMTRDVQDRILKDVNGNISDHLRNHIHLTNCIHLKNHMHKHSPILADRALVRDLVVLQRSRSLRDPSTSPHPWHSPSVADLLLERGEKDELIAGRRSTGIDRPAWAVSDRLSKDVIHEQRGIKMEESRGRFLANHPQNEDELVQQSISGHSGWYKSVKHKVGYRLQDNLLKTLNDQLKDIGDESDDNLRHIQIAKVAEERRSDILSHGNSLNKVKRRKYRGARSSRPSIATRDDETRNEMSVACNSFGQGRAEHYDHHVNGGPKNGCGIPWNWSRIHNRGKSFIDRAGRSLSCGLSESMLRTGGGSISKDMPVLSENSSGSSAESKSNGEEFPLLLDTSESQGSMGRAAWHHDYSGELGIFADNMLKQEIDNTDLRRSSNGGHQNLTQKYMPRTFRDLVGQNLVVQALSNAIAKRKIGMLYLLHGPHGTGKTSCARIFARALNCQSLEQPKPCGYCNSCRGKRRNVREIGPVSNIDIESLIELLDSMTASLLQSQYRVLILDECDDLSSDCWSAILKVIDRAPRRVVFLLVCSSLDLLPHIVISRSQKFFFPKLKDADIIYTLQWIATKEDLEIDKDALKLIASRSNGSLRDAEMTLEQLSLLGKRISLGLVQQLVGLTSDEKLVDLLDLALSADTINTVKSLRDIMESGVEPLALMSQLATVITDILAGSYNLMKERTTRKFFCQQTLSKEEMERLRQALKTLSEAEKQLRASNDRITWLTAALLQLAPDQHYVLPSSSSDTSSNHSTLVLTNASLRDRPRKSNAEMPKNGDEGTINPINTIPVPGTSHQGIEHIWLEVLQKIPIDSIKEFMYQEAKLISVSYGAAPTVQLLFNSQLAKSKAEKLRLHILHAFESVLGSPVTIEIRCESRKDVEARPPPSVMPTTDDLPITNRNGTRQLQNREASSAGVNMREIVEIEASHKVCRDPKRKHDKVVKSTGKTSSNLSDKNESLSLVPSKFSIGHVIQQGDGCSRHSGWSKRKAVSIAEKLEQENLRLESRSRGLLCWKPPRGTRRKLSHLRIRTRKPLTLLKYVSCGRCISVKSPR